MPRGLIDVRLRGYVLKLSATKIVIEDVLCSGQATRSAHDWHAFPHARSALTGSGRGREIEIDVVRNNQIQESVAIVVHESAACAPCFPISCNSRLSAYFAEDALLVVVQTIASVIGDVQIVPAVVIVVSNADSLAPAGGHEPSLL